MEQLPPECLGPKMQALPNDMQRRFAYLIALGHTQGKAAEGAGYTGKGRARITGCELMQSLLVLDAVEEAGRKVLRGLAPQAILAAKRVLDNPEHPAHARMIETVLDRTGHFAKTEHKVTVEHTVDVAELEALARRLANEAGIDPARLIGRNDPKLIEGEVIENQVVDSAAPMASAESGSR